MSPTAIAAYVALFVAAAASFLFINLLVGRFLRPINPHPEKLEVYECGEPTIGSSFVQFDLRFYVVALLFIIFDVEVALFFPWATVYGKATHLRDPAMARAQPAVAEAKFDATRTLANDTIEKEQVMRYGVHPGYIQLHRELGVPDDSLVYRAGGQDLDLTALETLVEQSRIEDRMGRPVQTREASEAERERALQLAEAKQPLAVSAVASTATSLAGAAIVDILVFFGVLMAGFAYVWSRGDLDWVRATIAQRAEQPERPPAAAEREQPVLAG
jgi:NADH-quinone oxidoreductase subunit A